MNIRKFCRFRLSSLLITVSVFAALLGVISWKLHSEQALTKKEQLLKTATNHLYIEADRTPALLKPFGSFGAQYSQRIVEVHIGLGANITKETFQPIADLPSLEVVSVENFSFSDGALKCLESTTTLTVLSLAYAPISNAGISSVADLHNLTLLYIGNAECTDEGLRHLKNLQSLKSLTLREMQITGQGLSFLANIPSLSELYLPGCPIDIKGMQAICKLHGLRKLSLEHCGLVNFHGLQLLKQLPKLEYLKLPEQVTDREVEVISEIKSLEEVDLSSTEISDAGIKHLLNLPHLRKVWLVDCANITDKGQSILNEKRIEFVDPSMKLHNVDTPR